MRRFEDWFGPGDICYVTRTFRSPQSLCDIASAFIRKNPDQMRKTVVSDRPGLETPVAAVAVKTNGEARAVAEHLQTLDEAGDGPTSVLLLGRKNSSLAPLKYLENRRWAHLTVDCSTVHRAKGAEADHVVVVDVCQGAFPSTIRDETPLQLAMPSSEDFPMSPDETPILDFAWKIRWVVFTAAAVDAYHNQRWAALIDVITIAVLSWSTSHFKSR